MKPITLQELIQATGGTLTEPDQRMDIVITGAQSDNRRIRPGDVFFAFPGERVDGHLFVKAALEAGAVGAVVSKRPAPEEEVDGTGDPAERAAGKFRLLVPDTVRAYGDLARLVRTQFHIPVIGITGSVGKTTTKDMTAAVLARHYRTAATEGNFNNNIGLPRTVLAMEEGTEAAVIEMGMNHPGEISRLTEIAQPTGAVITNIGEAHIGNLGSKENIFRAKCEIFEGLAGDGFAVLNGDDEYLVRLRDTELPLRDISGKVHASPSGPEQEGSAEQSVTAGSRPRLIYVGESGGCDWRAVDIDDTDSESVRFTAVTPMGTFPATVPAPGRHMIYPALTAAAVGAELGLSVQEIQEGIRNYVPTKLRMEIRHPSDSVVIYNDTYNANPQSMKAGLLTLSKAAAAGAASVPGSGPGNAAASGSAAPAGSASFRRIAVVGDMFELGDMEETLHREVGAYAAGLPIDTLVTVGAASVYLADEARKCGMADVRICPDRESAKAVIAELAGPDTAWLFKASRGMALETLASYAEQLMKIG